MKRLFSLFSILLLAGFALAQTPEEIIARMEAEMDKHEKDGIVMTVDLKIPLMGTMSTKTYTLGEKSRVEGEMMGVQIITWTDGKTEWTYNSKKNEVEIVAEDPKKAAEGSDAEMFEDVTDGYDVTLQKETAEAWHFLCKRNKSNTDPDAPKKIELAVAKGTYYPVSLKASLKGVGINLRGISFGVTEKQVTFNAADYPGITIIDKR